ncbi:MAG: endolytic transglycosylase MltG [Proteobacteria bacterium]|nr:endolytic transglycosylase MltG [Pseudomonadota bacterium]MBU1419699.1 endolytic transglycosylase MltG [Pseudomonadota bacterium]
MQRITLGVVLFLLLTSLCLTVWLVRYAGQKAGGDITETVTVVIPAGSTIRQISRILSEGSLVPDDIRFLIVARYLGLSAKLQAGEFALHRGQTPGDLLRELASARPIQHVVTIPEGLTIVDIAAIFASGGWCDRDEFIRLAKDPDFLKSLGLESRATLEGYLYPDTYHLTRNGHSAADLLRMQVRRFFSVWQDLQTEGSSPLSPYEVLILASMVEKETGQASERPLIAGVFHNRLKKGMRLQSDPTVIYGLENFSGNLTRKDLKTPSPYNTYTLDRLPAGPICNPGQEALFAVLHPAESKFLYFVSKNDGSHHFSKSLREHNRAVNKYQRDRVKELKPTEHKVVKE